MIGRLGLTLSVVAGLALNAAAQSPIQFQRTVSQTSVWPGDRLDYTITLRVSPEVKVALEDFDEKSVNFEPFFLVRRTLTSRETPDGNIRHQINYLLANFEVGDKQVEIPGLTFRYEGGRSAAEGPSIQEMRIPPFPILVRTTLNRPLQESWIRESLPTSSQFAYPWWLLTIGIVGIVLAGLPLGGWVWRQLPKWQARRQRLSRKDFIRNWQAELSRLTSDQQGEIKDRFGTLDRLVRSCIAYSRGIETDGLTSKELGKRLGVGGSNDVGARTLIRVLEHSEKCRYGPPDLERWEPILREDLEALQNFEPESPGPSLETMV